MNNESVTIMGRKLKQTYAFTFILGYIIVFLFTIISNSKFVALASFVIAIGFVYAFLKSYIAVFLFSVMILINGALAEGTFGSISTRRIIFVITIILLLKELRNIDNVCRKRMLIPSVFFIIWLVYMFIDSVIIHKSSISSIISIFMLFMVSFTLQLLALKNRLLAEKILLVIGIGFSLIVIVSYIEMLIGHTFFYSTWTGSERYRNGILRTGSTVSDPNNMCFMILPFLFLLETKAIKKIFGKKITKLLELLYVIAVIMSSSRAGWIALVLCLFLSIFAKRKAILLLVIPIIALVSGFLINVFEKWFGLYANSTVYRGYIIEQGLLQWSNNKLFGCGINSAVDVLNNGTSNTMNTYIYMLLGFGIIGLVLYCLYFIFLTRKDIVHWFKAKKISKDCVYRLCAIVSLCVIAYSIDTLNLALMWILPSVFIASSQYEVE